MITSQYFSQSALYEAKVLSDNIFIGEEM